jgi:hypothetical protein
LEAGIQSGMTMKLDENIRKLWMKDPFLLRFFLIPLQWMACHNALDPASVLDASKVQWLLPITNNRTPAQFETRAPFYHNRTFAYANSYPST